MFYSPLMKTLKALLFLAVATSTSFAADKIKVALTNQQAVNLYNALGSISPGLSPVDTIIAADDINVLEKVATDFMKGTAEGPSSSPRGQGRRPVQAYEAGGNPSAH
jgi:hypothetical protein